MELLILCACRQGYPHILKYNAFEKHTASTVMFVISFIVVDMLF